MKKYLLLLAGGILFPLFIFADSFGGQCTPAHSKIDLDINNVRTTLLVTGDMWWDLSTSHYEVPKGGGANSIFNGALWFGALDDGGQLLTACMTYRQTGVDFWAGPLDTATTTTVDTTCWAYDRFWKVNRADVEAFRAHYNDPQYTIPEPILSWPGNGNTLSNHAHHLAPFTDVDGDGIYNPHNGDYPAFSFNGQPDCNYGLPGDQAIWWVFNDKGNTHSETGGARFGMEVHATAYAFHTNDALNDATFYRYKIINRSTTSWNQMWMGQFMDFDLGAFDDDYVGCDVMRGMGYGYNGDVNDGTSAMATIGTYGAQPPAIGLDFVQGPLADANDLIDNDRDSILDENGERIKMAAYKYYNNDFGVIGNPQTAEHFYYYLQGLWLDGSPQTYGGNAYGGTIPTKFMFPGDSDPYGWGTGGVPQAPWTEASSFNTPYDRRFLASVGPFTMSPGEVQIVTLAVPWARDTSASGNNLTSLQKLKEADDYIQQMFDNCFALPCSQQALATFTSTVNALQAFFTADAPDGTYAWDFGDNSTSSAKHPSHIYTADGHYTVCLAVTTSCSTETVCNEVTIAAHANECGPSLQRLEGQGSGNQVIDFTAESVEEIFTSPEPRTYFPFYKPLHGPVRITYENYQSLVDGDYRIALDTVSNSGRWKMWRVGENDTAYSDSTIAYGEKQIISQWGLGVQLMQVPLPGFDHNPDRNGLLEATMTFDDPQKNWLSGIADQDVVSSFNWIRAGDLNTFDPFNPCGSAYNDRAIGTTFIDAHAYFEKMLGGTWAPYRLTADVPPGTGTLCYYAGVAYNNNSPATMINNRIENLASVDVVFTADKSKWTRCAILEMGSNSALTQGNQKSHKIRAHASVDKDGRTVAQGGLSDPSNPEAADYLYANGMSWFPGYAVNIETGERLNVCFGENSSLVGENGRDMFFNPTSATKSQFNDPLWGGMHTIFVFGHNGNTTFTTGPLTGELKDVPMYDEGVAIYKILAGANTANDLGEVYRDAMWASIPLLNTGHALLESTTTVRLRVAKPFAKYSTSATPQNNDNPMYGFHIDKMNLCCNLYNGAVNAFPNPFGESCTIRFDNTNNVPYNLKLYDMRGRLVRTYEDVLTDRIVIEGAGLMNGVYIYSLQTEGEKPVTGRIVLR